MDSRTAVEHALPWLIDLPPDDRPKAITELADALAGVHDVASFQAFQSDLHSWRLTSEIYTIPGMVARILADKAARG